MNSSTNQECENSSRLQSLLLRYLLIPVLLLIVIFTFASSDSAADIQPLNASAASDPLIGGMVAEVDAARMHATMLDLQNFSTRTYGSGENAQTAEYLHARLEKIPGLTVEYQGGDLQNVIGTLPGRDQSSDAITITGAHYDSASSEPGNAPGVTDNACGVAIVLELARVLSQYEYNNTILFAFWNAEEEGMRGSKSFAQYAVNNSLPVQLYLNYDSACYDPDQRLVLDIIYNNQTAPIADLITRYNALYEIDFTLTYNVHTCGSDHVSFWDVGYPAVMTHAETHGPAHTPEDTLDAASLVYAKKNAQLGIPVIVTLSGVR